MTVFPPGFREELSESLKCYIVNNIAVYYYIPIELKYTDNQDNSSCDL